MVCGRISLNPTTVTKGSSAKISISAVPPCPPPIIATRLDVTFDFDRRGLLLVMRGERGEGLGDGIDTHFHDREQVEDLSYEKIPTPVSYTHLRAHETDSYLVCSLLLEKKKTN